MIHDSHLIHDFFYEFLWVFLKKNFLWFPKHVSVKEKINPADIAKKQKKQQKKTKKHIFYRFF